MWFPKRPREIYHPVMFALNDNLIAHFSESRSHGRWDIIAYIIRRWRWCGCGFFPSVSLLPPRPSPFRLAYFPVRENYFFFTCHVKYNVDITPACYSNPLIFMSYNSRAPRKTRGLLKLFRRMILSPSLVVYAGDKTHGTLSIINGRRDMWYLETV